MYSGRHEVSRDTGMNDLSGGYARKEEDDEGTGILSIFVFHVIARLSVSLQIRVHRV